MVRSGRGSDGRKGHDFAEFLRRELHAAADQVEPGVDGLERIRAKIRSRPAHASQPNGVAGCLGGHRRLPPTAPWSGGLGGASGHARGDGTPKRPRDWREAMLRPAFGVGAAVFASAWSWRSCLPRARGC